MVYLTVKHALLSLAAFSTLAIAHPGHGGLKQEIAERMAYLKHNPRNLDHCADKLAERGVHARSLARRMAVVQDLQDKVQMKKRSLNARQTATCTVTVQASNCASSNPSGNTNTNGVMPSGGPNGSGGAPDSTSRQNLSDFGTSVANTSHLSTLVGISQNTSNVESLIFANTSCILNPEGEVGPYYVSGEFVRSDISEDQAGVPLYLDQQYIDVTTCEPITNLYADIWHCNATGVYAGVVAMGNGNSGDATNINSTFLRGIQKTDDNGVVAWETIFPGYYQGRTTHIHMVTHMGATALSNGTIAGGNITHVGQLMFDQDLTNKINENVSPYTSNTQSLTENTEDSVFIAETLTDSDPVVNYIKLGDDYEDGLFAWITIGVDPSATYNASAAAVMSEDGGYATGNNQIG